MLNCDDGLVDTSLHYENQLEFATREEAKKWVLEKGKEKNCVIVTNSGAKPKRFELVCKRSGKYISHKGKDSNSNYFEKTSRIYKTIKCECPFKIVFNKTVDNVWKMKVANGCHNHDPESLVGQHANAKLKPQKSVQLNMVNCNDGLGAVGVQANYSRRLPPTPSQQSSHFSSSGPSSSTTQLSRNPVNVPENLNRTQMKSSPSGHQNSGIIGQNGAGSVLKPVSSSVGSPAPASNQSLAVTQMLNCDDGLVDTSLHYENQLKFATREEAKKWVVEKGKEINCVIVSNNGVKPKRFELVCKRSGKHTSHKAKDYMYSKQTSRICKTSKCECPFKIVFNMTVEKVWKMKVANGCHNHDPESFVGHHANGKLKRQKSAQLHMANCNDGLAAVGVQANYFRRPPPTTSQQHFSSSGPSSFVTQLSRNPFYVPENLNPTQMKSSPSGHQNSGIMGQSGAGSELKPVSSPAPATWLVLVRK